MDFELSFDGATYLLGFDNNFGDASLTRISASKDRKNSKKRSSDHDSETEDKNEVKHDKEMALIFGSKNLRCDSLVACIISLERFNYLPNNYLETVRYKCPFQNREFGFFNKKIGRSVLTDKSCVVLLYNDKLAYYHEKKGMVIINRVNV